MSEAKTKQAAAQAAAEAQAEAPVEAGEELVSVRLFKDNDKYKGDVFVAVNGQSVLIRRGERVAIKKKFAEVLEQSLDQDQRTAGLIERESRAYEEAKDKLN
jgi:hypothetical protein|nr:MAG TPA: hypothetical protein [Caudoviricetes sp.]